MTTIQQTLGVQGGEPCVNNTRIPVRSIVVASQLYANNPDGFYAYTDGIRLSREDVAYALAWYAANPDEVDESIAENERIYEEMVNSPSSP